MMGGVNLLVGTPDLHRRLYEYMNGDDVGWPNLLLFDWEIELIWVHFIVYFIYLSYLC